MKSLIVLFAILLSFQISSQQQQQSFLSENPYSSYQPIFATKFWRFCKLSYCHPSRIQNWNYPKITNLYSGATDIHLFYNSTGDNAGYAFYYPLENNIYFVFRGTNPWSIKNWIDDINTLFTSYDKCTDCKVHQGFYWSYLSMKNQVISALQSLKSQYQSANVIVTGHSLGAALAVHAASDLSQYTDIATVYTYGLPRVGNSNFQQWFNTQVVGSGKFAARITHHQDPVPHLPFQQWGFTHINTEVYYNCDNTQYQVCQNGEDSTCSNQFLVDINVPDHLNYMGEDVTLDIIICGIL